MTIENNITTPDKRLLRFALIYNIITALLIIGTNFHQKYFYSYLAGFFALWIIGVVVLAVLFWAGKMRLKTNAEKVILLISTPVPMFLFIAFYKYFIK